MAAPLAAGAGGGVMGCGAGSGVAIDKAGRLALSP